MEKDKQIGLLIMTAVAVIVGLILLQGAAQNVGTTTNSVSAVNGSYTVASATAGKTWITGQDLLSTVVAINRTTFPNSGNETANSSVFTFAEGVNPSTGLKGIYMQVNTYPTWYGKTVGLTYTYGADGYISDGGGRAVAGIIIVFFGLLIAIIALYPAMKEMEMFR